MSSTPKTTTRRAVLAGLPIAAATLTPAASTALHGLATSAADDPIFAAIEAVRAADHEVYCTCDTERNDAACNAWREAFDHFLNTIPTTLPLTTLADALMKIDGNDPKPAA